MFELASSTVPDRPRYALLGVALFLASAVSAQTPTYASPTAKRYAPALTPSAEHVTAMRSIGWLVGDWEGTGWMMMGGPQRVPVKQKETVRWGAGGTALVIDGEGLGTASGSADEVIVHDAFAIITYDGAAKAYRLRALRAATGTATDDTREVTEGRIVWRLATPNGGHSRFTIEHTAAGEWHEVGHYSPDGTNWYLFMDMTLKRVDRR
jgi:hypothetical protein